MILWHQLRLWWHLRRGHTVVPAGGLVAIMWTGGDGCLGFYCRTCFGWLGRGKFVAPIATPVPRGWDVPAEDRARLALWRDEARRAS